MTAPWIIEHWRKIREQITEKYLRLDAERERAAAIARIPRLYPPDRFFSPFESNVIIPNNKQGWRWYHRFMKDYPDMQVRVLSDTMDCLSKRGLVWC